MDIDLLSKMVRELILDNDAVTLPGVGSFVADLVPSVFSDKGYTINPPYRRLYFTPREGIDTLLVDLYASSNQVDRAAATRILVEFLAAMKEELKVRKTIVFPGLGRLRATRENHFFFVADEDLDIYPAGFGLAPISLKTHVETPEEVATAVSGLAQQLLDPVPEETPAEAPVKPASEAPAVPVETELQFIDEPADEPISATETPEIVDEPVDEPISATETPEIVDEPVDEPISATETPENVDEPVDEPALPARPQPAAKPPTSHPEQAHLHHPKHRPSGWKTVLLVLGILLALALLAALVLAIVGRVAPDFVDRFLYSAEELAIIHY